MSDEAWRYEQAERMLQRVAACCSVLQCVAACIGVCLIKHGDTNRMSKVVEELVVAESLFEFAHVARLSVKLRRGSRYIIVPSTDRAGMEGSYALECFSDETVLLEKIPDVRQKKLVGEWRGATAGMTDIDVMFAWILMLL